VRLKKLQRRSMLALAAWWAVCPAAAAPSPVGLWQTFDDHTGQPRAVVRIFEAGGVLHGRVEQILDAADTGQVCEKCRDERHGKPILGMEIFTDLRPTDDGWQGHILDPQTGSIYTCTARLTPDGQGFVLRGYIVISLIGRSQTWKRIPAA
jgi:uncharacterized protein (DUF2147 family)